ncbi:MAG TPA: hypothetical protein VK760_04405 [Candidatus Acidoferrales bacterium]|jgi:hypothetical protein|nr:hypothetical protein [Candidatus Acidoferrales bacterium]
MLGQSSLRPLATALLIGAVTACSSAAGHAAFVPQPAPAFAAAAKIRVSKKRVSFVGAGTTQLITVSERGFAGVLHVKSDDVHVAKVKPRKLRRGSGAFEIVPVSGGKATITVSDSNGNSANVEVSVTALTLVLKSVPASAASVTINAEFGSIIGASSVALGGSAKNCKTVAGKRNCTISIAPNFGTAKKPVGTVTNIVLMNFLDSSKNIVANVRFYAKVTAAKFTSVEVPLLTFSSMQSVPGYPYTLAAGSDGRVWYVDPHNGTVGAAAPGGAVATYQQGRIGQSFNQAASFALGSQGKLWMAVIAYDYTVENAYVDSISPSGAIAPYSVTKPVTGCSQFNWNQPLSIAAGADGNLWYLEMIPKVDCSVTYGIGVMSQSGIVLHDYTLPQDSSGKPIYTFWSNAQQHEIAAGPDGAMYFWASKCALSSNTCTGTTTSSAIGRITTTGAQSFTPVQGLTNCQSGYLARGGDGNVWFGAGCVPAGTPYAHTTIGRVTNAGITLFYGQNTWAMDYPLLDLAEGPDGNLYMPAQGQFGRFVTTGASVGQIDEYDTPLNRGGHFLNSMVTGPDHNLYASDCGACVPRGGSYLERISLP